MREVALIFCTSGLTIIGGIILLVFGELATRFIIEPIHEQKKVISDIAEAIVFYANLYSNPGTDSSEERKHAKEILRQKASLLRAKTYAIPGYKYLIKTRLVKSYKEIEAASSSLIGLSNAILSGDPMENMRRRDEIVSALGLHILGG